LENNTLTVEQVSSLAQLPPAEVLKAQLLGLFNQPATQMVRIIQAVPQGLLNVLQAKAGEEN
jgi:large subunit ribosomal protein L10